MPRSTTTSSRARFCQNNIINNKKLCWHVQKMTGVKFDFWIRWHGMRGLGGDEYIFSETGPFLRKLQNEFSEFCSVCLCLVISIGTSWEELPCPIGWNYFTHFRTSSSQNRKRFRPFLSNRMPKITSVHPQTNFGFRLMGWSYLQVLKITKQIGQHTMKIIQEGKRYSKKLEKLW